MVKYNHCERCKSIYNTEPWIGEVHSYNGVCPSCKAKEQQEDKIQQEIVNDHIRNKDDSEHVKILNETHETTQSSPIDTEKKLLSGLEQKVDEFLSSGNSVDVLIKDIKDGLVDKARERIEETFQSFDAGKIDAQKVVDYVETMCNYVSDYKDYMDCVVLKLQDKPKMKIKTAIEKVFKETMSDMPKDVAKDTLLNKKAMLKTVFDKVVECYSIYSDIEDVMELTKKMVLHPFKTIQNKLSTLPFYTSS
ncbi:MAG: hypothetical protein ACFFAI_15285 [Promethearchaeota archaeon]